MSNMGYCRFTNTVKDMEDCIEHLWDKDLDDGEEGAEKDMRDKFIELCKSVAEDFEDEE